MTHCYDIVGFSFKEIKHLKQQAYNIIERYWTSVSNPLEKGVWRRCFFKLGFTDPKEVVQHFRNKEKRKEKQNIYQITFSEDCFETM